MKVHLKPLAEQTAVVTGASSGIGLATAKALAAAGARVLLISREEQDLADAVAQIREAGGQAEFFVADVADRAALQAAAAFAAERFGGVDTWVNNAGTSIYGRMWEITEEDARRLFDTNYWGVVNGSLTAVEHLRARGGALINIGSVLSDRAILIQGHYSATKHAVKGFTDALRMEIERDELPISVTLVKPTSIASPFPEHARNYMDKAPTVPPPIYAPEVVARAVCACAEKPVRDITVGGAGKMLSGMGALMPRVMDKFMENVMYGQQRRDEPSGDGAGILHAPIADGARVRGAYSGHVMKSSLYTQAALHPAAAVLGALALGVGIALAGRRRR